MIETVNIKNYKSVSDLNIELGRFNVFIGENGCGKSNILEAICLGAAAANDKLDNEFLASRGIRVSDPQLMRSAFKKANLTKDVELKFLVNNIEYHCALRNDNKAYSKWVSKELSNTSEFGKQMAEYLIKGKKPKIFEIDEETETTFNKLRSILQEATDLVSEGSEPIGASMKNSIMQGFESGVLEALRGFVIYSPENTSLRTFEKEGQIEPLGINGEGLFRLLKTFSKERGKKRLKEIKKHVDLIDWFSDFDVPTKLFEGEKYLQIKDKYLDSKLDFIDQRNANEGFLFLLFYASLFISDETPPFFAIDNIEASLNPKLCHEMVKTLNSLSTNHNKQVILTTHNPAVLDGIDIKDDQQRLFVIYRNKLGHTKYQRILNPEISEDVESIRLSEAFSRGYLGGLPRNF